MPDSKIGPIVGVILAGGRAERMGGGDKCLLEVAGKPILARVTERVRPQVDALVLNANGDPVRFGPYGLPMAPDSVPDFAGPLAGVLAGLEWAEAHHPHARHIVTVPADGPFVPRDLVKRLAETLVADDAELVTAASGVQTYPVVGLWPVRLRQALRDALVREDLHKVDAWTRRFRRAIAAFPANPIDPFFNANTPEQLAEADRLAALYPDI
ncbi:molybdenum cofactor guanylyltransferase MobA [Dongia deserti]|uniref:molybdenum cofactor guanylyltransferase MobA n=1 Tax=Dongia deserti TaxID=2268030 RepID=UPI000E653B26|nr:molybdenum cofactor guanylyltransferase MobA [Dongia deserti]